MKFIHTGDWHIGKIVNEFSMLQDQRFMLNQLVDIIKMEEPSALIIAGDLYDRSVPPADAVELLDEIFNKIIMELKVPILAIAGNHDSPERLSFGSSLLKDSGLHLEGILQSKIRKVNLKDEHGNINFFLMPYGDPAYVRELYGDSEIKTHEDAVKKIIDNIDLNEDERNVLVAHGYVTNMKNTEEEEEDEFMRAGLITSSSERPLSIGGTDLISAGIFEKFNYVALGHLHGPQKVGSDKIRYSGSLLKYSFSEVNQRKGVTVVEIDDKGEVKVDFKQIKPLRDMRIIKGPIKELISPEVYEIGDKEDYIQAILTDQGEVYDPISKLRAVYPNIMALAKENSINEDSSITSAKEGYKDKDKLELFNEFFESIEGRKLTAEQRSYMEVALDTLWKEDK
ncbi:exonuclease SbcCD subunit D [Clostridium sp. 'White wine YQ']|uniref:exonuclease SbcCD subunit D n=1 Tax=Clostridium sp. 'White wine YQ' TaxID=3027474 RepID=UPI002365CDF3|nr:exonuclease SbcCD subunit D [Clostridium sp. 'White wine YQ']MDD7796032.1 exonuclease SbcCD subunit D [Clostridium sp. 'White wine YQ']